MKAKWENEVTGALAHRKNKATLLTLHPMSQDDKPMRT